MKKRLIDELQRKHALTEMAASQQIDNVFSALASTLDAGDKVNIVGFGTFERVFKDTRAARNPRTGETVTVQGHHVVKFRPAKARKR